MMVTRLNVNTFFSFVVHVLALSLSLSVRCVCVCGDQYHQQQFIFSLAPFFRLRRNIKYLFATAYSSIEYKKKATKATINSIDRNVCRIRCFCMCDMWRI